MADYHMFKVGDVGFAGAVRWDVTATVEPGTTRDELLDIARSIAMDFRESRPYHALSVGFADAPQYLERGAYPLGYWHDAPHGRWSKARHAAADYSNFAEADHLRDKDWGRRPTLTQADLWARFGDRHAEPEEVVIADLADDEGRSVDEVRTDLHAVAFWTAS
jgi:hypothetical protein